MALTKKSSPQRKVKQTGTDLPDQLVPPLPESVITRFPALKEWAESIEKNYQLVREVHAREMQVLADYLNN